MKTKILLIVTLFFILSSCTPYYQQCIRVDNLNPIITFPHNKAVKIFFSESSVTKPYVEIRVLEASNGSYQELINRLKIIGQNVGVDAIILIQNTETGGGEYSLPTHTLYGLGIKYKENIDYLDQFIKTEKVFLVKDREKTLVSTITRSMENNILSQSDSLKYYANYILPYDLLYLQYDNTERWYEMPGFNSLERVQKVGDYTITKRVLIEYNIRRQIEEININNTYSFPHKIKILVHYKGEKGDIIADKVISTVGNQWKETFLYNSDQKLIGKLIDKLENGKEVPFLRVEYEYYRNEDLEDILNLN